MSLTEDLQLAAQVHYSFLPEDYEDDRVSIAVTLEPLYTIGGDYCSILSLSDDHLLICTCDAVGHGIAAALFAARVNTFILTHAHTGLAPCELVAGLNSYLCKRMTGTGMYSSLYVMLLDFREGSLSVAGAGHPPVVEYVPGEEQGRQWPSVVTYLGIMDPMPMQCATDRIPLQPGQRFLLYSDGLIEIQNAAEELFGIDRLTRALIEDAGLAGQELNRTIIQQAKDFGADGFTDDILLISIAVKGS